MTGSATTADGGGNRLSTDITVKNIPAMIVNVSYSKREYGRMKRNGESEISTMT